MLTTKRHDFVIGATTEVAALKTVLTEAEDKAAKERTEREKHEARVGEVQQELQDAMKKYESLERHVADQDSKLTKARQSTQDARVEAQGTLQEIQEARKIAAGKAFIMQSKYMKKMYLLLTRIWSSLGAFADLRAVWPTLQSSSKPKRGARRRSCSGRNTLRQNIRCPLAIS